MPATLDEEDISRLRVGICPQRVYDEFQAAGGGVPSDAHTPSEWNYILFLHFLWVREHAQTGGCMAGGCKCDD